MMTAPAPAATASLALAITNDDRKPPNDASVREARAIRCVTRRFGATRVASQVGMTVAAGVIDTALVMLDREDEEAQEAGRVDGAVTSC